MTVGNTIRVPEDFTIADRTMAATLIHELTHVWQYQHAGTSYISVSLGLQLAGTSRRAVAMPRTTISFGPATRSSASGPSNRHSSSRTPSRCGATARCRRRKARFSRTTLTRTARSPGSRGQTAKRRSHANYPCTSRCSSSSEPLFRARTRPTEGTRLRCDDDSGWAGHAVAQELQQRAIKPLIELRF